MEGLTVNYYNSNRYTNQSRDELSRRNKTVQLVYSTPSGKSNEKFECDHGKRADFGRK